MRDIYAHTFVVIFTLLLLLPIFYPVKDWVFNTLHILQGSAKADRRRRIFFHAF